MANQQGAVTDRLGLYALALGSFAFGRRHSSINRLRVKCRYRTNQGLSQLCLATGSIPAKNGFLEK